MTKFYDATLRSRLLRPYGVLDNIQYRIEAGNFTMISVRIVVGSVGIFGTTPWLPSMRQTYG